MARIVVQANKGRVLEDLIELALANVPGMKLFRQANIWVPLRGGRQGAFPFKGAPVDFVGAVNGIPVALECKEVGRGKRLSLTGHRLPVKEIEAMREFEEAGGRAFLLVAFWQENVLSAYPWRVVEGELASGARSIHCGRGFLYPLGSTASLSLFLERLLGGGN